ncbi:intradiol ring-cleavage dioxygenase [Mucilaginibacter sp.]|jgi:protocatechuate 3,4-dioxygenase beta subunit|uniref:intradiol ring-cleavage dioxygenase n=1 Tax=Mucilaginibacter sp. TaxID=1882438 RepID=UPI002C1969B9|nr:intradiol ring-cleavage dioxygenase [Mucilaginibacter sp.]HTI59528.1 intradiol ring-cleavage dioxygenase [Mucilaginibacter sp.]
MERKNFLKAFALAAAAGPMILDGCKKDSVTKTSTSTTTGTTSTTTTSTSGSCIVTATEVEGPYPYPGGELTNPLERSDVTEGTQTGVPLSLTFIVVDAGNNCNVVSDARVDIWHCNKDGYYSGYANQSGILGAKSYVGSTFLRGYQLTDSTGLAKFTTIYPGWYSGRATHIHIEVYVNGVMKKTTQICFSEATNNTVYGSSLYSAHGSNTTTNEADSIFGDSLTDLANETVSLTGSVSEGYTGSYTIGINL